MDQAEKLRNMMREQSVPRSVARVFTVTSGKGGVGKSSVSVNLALSLSRLGKRVVILDADFGLANIEVMLGIRPKYTLADLMFRGKSLSDIITTGPEQIGFISGGSGIQEMTNLKKDQLIFLINKLVELDRYADIVIIDTGAGISDSVVEFITAGSEPLLVTTPEPTSITDSYALLKTLNRKLEEPFKDVVIRMISNRVGKEKEGAELYAKLNVVVAQFLELKLEYLGALPQDKNVTNAVIKQMPIVQAFPNSPFSRSVLDLAKKLVEEDVDSKENKKGIAFVFSNLITSKFRNDK